MTFATVFAGVIFCFMVACLFCLLVLVFIGRHHDDNLDLYPPPGPPRPAPAPTYDRSIPRKVVPFPPVKVSEIPKAWRPYVVEPPKTAEELGIKPPPPAPGKTITFAPWMTEEQKQRIIEHWRKENFE